MFSRYRVSGLGFRCSGFFWVQGFAFGVRVSRRGFGFGVSRYGGFEGRGFTVLGFAVRGFGFRVFQLTVFRGTGFPVRVFEFRGFMFGVRVFRGPGFGVLGLGLWV